MRTRKITVIAASVGVAVAAATGVTYASSALESAPKSASIVQDAAPVAPRGGNGTGTEAGSNAAADAAANDNARQSKGSEGRGGNGGENRGENRGENHGNRHDEGRIYVNERSYAADPGSCIAVINLNNPFTPSVNPTSFNIRNESERTVEFYRGITCDNGAPVATVGPRSSSHAVAGEQPTEGLAVVGSFRVIDGHGHGHGHH